MSADPLEAHLRRADECFAAGDFRQAGQIWQAILKRDPSHSRAREGLIRVKQALEMPPPKPPSSQAEVDLLLRQASQLWDLGTPEDALEKWQKVLDLDPQNREAKTFIDLVSREMADTGSRVPQPPPRPAFAPLVAPMTARTAAPVGDIELLLRQAAQLWDLGVPEDALEKWGKVLEFDPENEEARSFIDRVRREEAEAVTPARPAPPPRQAAVDTSFDPPPQPSRNAPTTSLPSLLHEGEDSRLRQAEHLMDLNRFQEAEYSFQQILAQHPDDPRAREGLARAQQQGVRPDPAPKAKQPAPAVALPATLTAAPKRRQGLDVPEPLRALAAHPLVQSPLTWAGAVAGFILITVGITFWRQAAKDRQLKADVNRVIQEALVPAVRASSILEIEESTASILAEAKATAAEDPLRSYHRAKEALRRSPEDPGAAQLLEQAKAALAASGPTPLEDLAPRLKSGDLDPALGILLKQLHASPDDPKLLRKAAYLLATLAQLHASKGKWGAAKEHLLRARALFPQDRAWNARLQLLETIPTQPKVEQAGWIALLW